MLLLLAAATSLATPFPRKTMHGSWTERQSERELVLPKGWFATGLSFDTKHTGQYRNRKGQLRAFDNGTRWHYSRLWLQLEQGFSRRITLYAHIPFVEARLSNDLGVNTRNRAMGDAHTGVIFQPVTGRVAKGAFRLDLKAPSGVEWTSDFIGGPDNIESFVTGTGITNLGLHVEGRVLLGEVASVDGSFGYTFKLPSVVGYIVQPNGFGNGWLDPGDELRARLAGTLQLSDDVAVRVDTVASDRGPHRIGTSGQSVFKTNLTRMRGTAGTWLDAGVEVSWEPTDEVELAGGLSRQLAGGDTRTFQALGLEELAPQPGNTVDLRVVKRW